MAVHQHVGMNAEEKKNSDKFLFNEKWWHVANEVSVWFSPENFMYTPAEPVSNLGRSLSAFIIGGSQGMWRASLHTDGLNVY